MKKVKFMLMAVAVLAIVGGALAFKATKFNADFCYLTPQTEQVGPVIQYYCPGDQRWTDSAVPEACEDILIDVTNEETPTFITTYCTTDPNPTGAPCDKTCPVTDEVFEDN